MNRAIKLNNIKISVDNTIDEIDLQLNFLCKSLGLSVLKYGNQRQLYYCNNAMIKVSLFSTKNNLFRIITVDIDMDFILSKGMHVKVYDKEIKKDSLEIICMTLNKDDDYIIDKVGIKNDDVEIHACYDNYKYIHIIGVHDCEQK